MIVESEIRSVWDFSAFSVSFRGQIFSLFTFHFSLFTFHFSLFTFHKKWDQELNRVYKALMGKLSNNRKAKNVLRSAQRAWLKYKNAEMKTIAVIYGSLQGTKWVPVAVLTRVDIIKERTLMLKSYLDNLEMAL